MKPDTRQARAAAHPLELTRNVIRPERRTVLTAADVIALAVGFAILFAVGVLSAAQIGQIPPERVGQRQRPIAGFGLYAVRVDHAPGGQHRRMIDDHAPCPKIHGTPAQTGALAAAQTIGCRQHKRCLCR